MELTKSKFDGIHYRNMEIRVTGLETLWRVINALIEKKIKPHWTRASDRFADYAIAFRTALRKTEVIVLLDNIDISLGKTLDEPSVFEWCRSTKWSRNRRGKFKPIRLKEKTLLSLKD
jgi:hypothetical protein